MTTTITVYSKPHCVQCDATTRYLDKHRIPYVYRELEDHPDVVDAARAQNILLAPVVTVTGGGHDLMWGGFRLTRLEELPVLTKEKNA